MAKSPVSPKILRQLRTEWAKVETVDPSSSSYKRLTLLLSLMTQSQLKTLVDANIKFVSILARNRLKKPIEKASVEKETAMNVLSKLTELASEKPMNEVAPAAVLVAHTVQKIRDGDQHSTFELSSFIKRLAFSPLTETQIADRLTEAFGDVLLQQE